MTNHALPPNIAVLPTALPIARYRFTAIVQQPLTLPDYAGSLLRGQFGAALRQISCMTRQPTCSGCRFIQTCSYTRIFEAPAPPKGQHTLQDFSQIPNPYVVEPPESGARLLASGDALIFNLVLIGHALAQLALVVLALQRALAHGLTHQRVPADLIRVEHINADGTPQCVWSQQQPTLATHTATLRIPAVVQNHKVIALRIHTPLRLQHQGQPLGTTQLTARALVCAVARRSALLMQFHADPHVTSSIDWGQAARHAAHASASLRDEQDLQWFDWTRYSSRQRQEMALGGVLGRWTLYGCTDTLASVWPWLWLGQWLHAGKNATMGLGAFTLESAQPHQQPH